MAKKQQTPSFAKGALTKKVPEDLFPTPEQLERQKHFNRLRTTPPRPYDSSNPKSAPGKARIALTNPFTRQPEKPKPIPTDRVLKLPKPQKILQVPPTASQQFLAALQVLRQMVRSIAENLGRPPLPDDISKHMEVSYQFAKDLLSLTFGNDLTGESESGDAHEMRAGKDLRNEPVKEVDAIAEANFGSAEQMQRLEAKIQLLEQRLASAVLPLAKQLTNFALVEEAAKQKNTSPTHIHRAINDGRLPSYELAGNRRIVNLLDFAVSFPNGIKAGKPKKN